MTTDKVHFTKEKETMLMTLNSRAIQSQWKDPILRDPWAEEALRHIDYDMSKQLKGVSSWGLWKDIGPTIIATRAAPISAGPGCGLPRGSSRSSPEHRRFQERIGRQPVGPVHAGAGALAGGVEAIER